MPGTTPNRHYPYPVGSDPAARIAQDIQALALAVDADFASQITAADLTTALAGYLKLTGGALTGTLTIDPAGSVASLSLRDGGNVPSLEFRSHDAATRYALIQGVPASITYTIDSASGFHLFRVGTAERFRVSPTGGILSGALTITGAASVGGGLNVTGNLGATGDLNVNDITASGGITATGDVHAADLVLSGTVDGSGVVRLAARAYIGGDGNQLNLIDTVVGGAGTNYDVLLNFYGQGTTTAPGTRAGYLGYAGTSRLQLVNQVDGADLLMTTLGAGDVLLSPGVGGEIHFQPNNTFQGFMAGSVFIWGKAASDLANAGIEMFGAGSAAEGSIRSTVAAANIQNLLCRHESVAAATGQAFIHFYIGSAVAGSITQNGSGVLYNQTSDYRLKDVLGEVADPLARLMELAPRRLAWKVDGSTFDGFLAHEVQAVVPEAVSGEKDAVLPDTDEFDPGGIDPQQLDQTKIIPLLVAAVQELAAEVAALKAGA